MPPLPSPAPPLNWTAHPLRQEQPSKTALLCLIIALVGFGVAWIYQTPLWGLFAWIVLAAAMSRYFLPTHYRLDENGIVVSHLHSRRYPWHTFRRAVIGPHRIFLSPFARRHRLDSFRGVHLHLGARADQVARRVRHYVPTEPS